jgi:flagellar hook-associated protein 2
MSTTSPLSSLTDALGTSGTGSTTSGTGLGAGINVQQFVQFAVANQEAAITALQNQQTTLGTQTSALASISSDLANLQSAADALSDPLGALSALAATSSNSSVVSATAASTAAPGSHTITVSSLATTSAYYSNELATSGTTISAGTFNLQVGANTAVPITVNSTDNTLSGLAANINNQNLGVTASVIQDANGFRLALVSNTTGTPGDITISGNTTGLTFTNVPNSGANAQLTVDGIPISSASNTVTNVINGVTLNLGSVSANPVAVNVSADTSQATTAINNFVSAYNTVVGDFSAQFNVASDGSGGGPLLADNSLSDAQSLLLGAVSASVTGNNGIVNLASIGVNMNDNGTLSVDNGTLQNALATNYSSVQNLFQNSTTGFAQNLSNAVNTINAPGNGILTLDSQGISSSSQALTQQINDLQAALTVQEANLTTVYSNVNTTLQELPLLENQTASQLAAI